MIDRSPILLVHGINDTTKIFRTMEKFLHDRGWEVHSFNMIPNNGDGDLADLARQVEAYIRENFCPEQRFDLLGFSMGGIVSRYYLQRLGGVQQVDRFISISGPNAGTQTAYLSQRIGCRQMRPDSEFLANLNQDGEEILGQVKFTSIWTPLDLMIIPAQSSRMSIGKEIVIPVPLHQWVVTDLRVLEAIAQVLLD